MAGMTPLPSMGFHYAITFVEPSRPGHAEKRQHLPGMKSPFVELGIETLPENCRVLRRGRLRSRRSAACRQAAGLPADPGAVGVRRALPEPRPPRRTVSPPPDPLPEPTMHHV